MSRPAVIRTSSALPRLRARWVVAGLVLLLAACQQATSAPPAGGPPNGAAPGASVAAPMPPLRPTQVGYSSHSATQAALHIAKASGLYARYGLDVDLRYVESNTSIASLLAQEVEIATVGADLVASAVASGGDLLILATPLNTYPQVLVVVPEIGPAADLKGKRVGVTRRGDITDTAARVALTHLGVSPDEVDIVQIGEVAALLAALETRAVQAASISPPADGPARRAGFRVLLDVSTLGLPQPAANVGTTRRFANAEPAVVDRFLRAYLEAIKLYKTERAQVGPWLGEFARIDDQQVIDDNLDWVERTLPRLPLPTVEGMQSVITRVGRENPDVARLTPEDLMDPGFLQRIEASGFLRQLWGE